MSERIVDPSRQGISPADMPDDVGDLSSVAAPYSLERTLTLMDAWNDEMDWGLHQMCRALRAELEKVKTALDALDVANAELAALNALKAALPDIVACANSSGLVCNSHPWASCCVVRQKICAALNLPINEPPKRWSVGE